MRRFLTWPALVTGALLSACAARAAPPVQAPAAMPAPARTYGPEPAPAPAETKLQMWTRARALADQGRYAPALATIDSALRRFPGDPELLWLEAAVTGWSGRHAEAAAKYDALTAQHPEMARDLRSDLAAERLWSDDAEGAIHDYQLRVEEAPADREARRRLALALAYANRLSESLAAYDALLAETPEDVDVALERARVLGWMGRHDQAIAAYREILAAHPDERRARLGIAQNENWAGRHREAAELYQALSAERADAESEKGLALAYYWSGDSERSRETLGRVLAMAPDDREAQSLAARLAREQSRSLSFGSERSDDSDGLRVRSFSVDYRQPLASRTSLLAVWRRDQVEDAGGSHEPWRIGAGLEKSWSERWTGRATALLLKPDADHGMRMLADVSFTHRPADRVRLDYGWSKDQVLTRLALDQGIFVNTWVAGVDWQARPRLLLRAAERLGFYNDDNRQSHFSAGARMPYPMRHGEVALLVDLAHVRSLHDLDHGYYDPEWYVEIGPGVDLEWRPAERWVVGFTEKVGIQHEKGSDQEPFNNFLARADIPLGLVVALHVEGGRGDSNLSSASGFQQKRWAAFLSTSF